MSEASTPIPTVTPVSSNSQNNDNILAAVASLPLVGLIMYYGMKDISSLVKFYAKQSIGLLIISVVLMVASVILGFIPIIGWILGCILSLVWVVIVVAQIILIINALQGKEFRLPVISDLVDQIVK